MDLKSGTIFYIRYFGPLNQVQNWSFFPNFEQLSFTSKMHLISLIFILLSLDRFDCLIKNEKPIIEELFTPSKLIENKKFSITCQPNSGHVDFEWHFNGRKITPNDNIAINQVEESSILNIRSMNLDHAGEYTCKIKNSVNQEDSRTISVKLNGKLN